MARNSKLMQHEVDRIRESTAPLDVLAKHYGVSTVTIRKVKEIGSFAGFGYRACDATAATTREYKPKPEHMPEQKHMGRMPRFYEYEVEQIRQDTRPILHIAEDWGCSRATIKSVRDPGYRARPYDHIVSEKPKKLGEDGKPVRSSLLLRQATHGFVPHDLSEFERTTGEIGTLTDGEITQIRLQAYTPMEYAFDFGISVDTVLKIQRNLRHPELRGKRFDPIPGAIEPIRTMTPPPEFWNAHSPVAQPEPENYEPDWDEPGDEDIAEWVKEQERLDTAKIKADYDAQIEADYDAYLAEQEKLAAEPTIALPHKVTETPPQNDATLWIDRVIEKHPHNPDFDGLTPRQINEIMMAQEEADADE